MLLDELGRRLWLKALTKLTSELPILADNHRHNRDPDDSACFIYPVIVVDLQGKPHWTFRFFVDDTHEAGLRVVGYGRSTGSIG